MSGFLDDRALWKLSQTVSLRRAAVPLCERPGVGFSIRWVGGQGQGECDAASVGEHEAVMGEECALEGAA